jgi:hypothetical protein
MYSESTALDAEFQEIVRSFITYRSLQRNPNKEFEAAKCMKLFMGKIRSLLMTNIDEAEEVKRMSNIHNLPGDLFEKLFHYGREFNVLSAYNKLSITSPYTMDADKGYVMVEKRKDPQEPFEVFKNHLHAEAVPCLRLHPSMNPEYDFKQIRIVDRRWWSQKLGCYFFKLHPEVCALYKFVDAEDETNVVHVDGGLEGWIAEKTGMTKTLTQVRMFIYWKSMKKIIFTFININIFMSRFT